MLAPMGYIMTMGIKFADVQNGLVIFPIKLADVTSGLASIFEVPSVAWLLWKVWTAYAPRQGEREDARNVVCLKLIYEF